MISSLLFCVLQTQTIRASLIQRIKLSSNRSSNANYFHIFAIEVEGQEDKLGKTHG